MKLITETPRLILRELTVDDAIHFYQLNADPEVLRYTGDDPFQSVDAAREFLENYHEYEKNGYGRWAVISKETGKFLGWNGLKLNEEYLVDLGYRLYREEWGKGYATESSEAVLEVGFKTLGIKEIIGRSATANTASMKVVEKIEMNYWKNDGCMGIDEAVYYRINRKTYFENISYSE